jgi:SH3-like domain-containing protein
LRRSALARAASQLPGRVTMRPGTTPTCRSIEHLVDVRRASVVLGLRLPPGHVRACARWAGLAVLLLAAHVALALEFRSVSVDAAVLYDAPSVKARKLFLLGRDYPVEVLVGIEGWTKVRDASGELAWVEDRDLAARRTVMVRVVRAPVRDGPDESARVVFEAEQDVVLEFLDMAGNYVKVRHADGALGYIRVTQVWGL